MKFCPNCGKVYPDSGADMCDEDGTPLLLEKEGIGQGTLVWDDTTENELTELTDSSSQAHKSTPAPEPRLQTTAPAGAPVAPTPREGKICYFCDRAYPAQAETCEEDGAILVDLGTSPETGATLRLIKHCPTCAREFDHGYRCPHDNAILATKARDDVPLVDTTLGGSYRIGDVIGRGGMGLVYRARQMPIGRAVAIKVLLPSLQPDPTYIKRFFREAKILGRLVHPNIVSLVECGNTTDGLIYLVTEFLTGKTLDQVVPEGEGVSFTQLRMIMEQVCDAVGEAHRHKLIHRDLKPQNVFILETAGARPHVKVLDFGVAKPLQQTGSELTQVGVHVGTPGYMAPEQYQNTEAVSERSDIYALGALVYFLATGRPAFVARTPQSLVAKQLHGPPAEVDFAALGKPPQLNAVISKAMAYEQDDRFRTTEDLANAIAAVGESGAWSDSGSKPLIHGFLPANFTMPEASDTQPNEIRDVDKPLAITEPSRVVPPELKRAQRTNILLLILAIGVALAAAVFAVFYVGPFGNQWTTTVVEIEPESYGDASGVQGATETTITLGMTGDFAGPAEDLGLAMRLGVMARFREQNDLGGVGTRQLKLEALGDGSDPQRAAENVRTLIRDKRVFGFIGTLGTPTSAAAIAASDGALFIGPYADAAGLRASPSLFHYRPGAADECAALVMHLVNHGNVSPRRLAVLAAASPVGDRAAAEVMRTLEQYNVSKDAALRLTYPAGTAEIDTAARDLVRNRARIEAVIAVVPPQAAVRFIEIVRNKRLRIPMAFTSAVGGNVFTEGLRRLGDRYLHRVIVSQVVPPFYSDLVGVVRYRKAMAKYFPEAKPGFVSLEGYLVASLFIEAVARIQGGLTIQTLINSLESIHGLDLGFEASISFSPSDHQGSERIWITRINKSGGFEPVK